jgi:hypothetical protein
MDMVAKRKKLFIAPARNQTPAVQPIVYRGGNSKALKNNSVLENHNESAFIVDTVSFQNANNTILYCRNKGN